MTLEQYIQQKLVIATADTYAKWLKKTRRSKVEYVLVTKSKEMENFPINETEVYFVADYWKADSVDEKFKVCISRHFKIIHVDSF